MKFYQRLLFTMVLLGVFIVSVGCSHEKTVGTASNDSPDIIVQNFFRSLQNGDIEQAASFLEKDDKELRELSTDPAGEKMAKLFLQQLTYETGSYHINGEEASISVKVTTPNMLKIAGSTVKNVISGLISGEMNDEAQAERKALENMEKSIKDPSTPKITTSQTIKLTKTEAGWKISTIDTEFLKTFVGL